MFFGVKGLLSEKHQFLQLYEVFKVIDVVLLIKITFRQNVENVLKQKNWTKSKLKILRANTKLAKTKAKLSQINAFVIK
jgi:hypothetical protein